MKSSTARPKGEQLLQLVAAVWALVMDLLRMEAHDSLLSDAEHEASEGADCGVHAIRWYGIDTNRTEERALKNKQTALELAMRECVEKLECARIRDAFNGSKDADPLAVQQQELDVALATVDAELWALQQQTEGAIAAERDRMVEAKAEQLKDEYLRLSLDMPFNVWHPAVPEFLRAWMRRQEKRGAFEAVEVYRLLAYLVLRDTVFTGVWNTPPVIEDDELPSDNPLELAGRPASKKEARMQKLLDGQFIHANFDRRVGRSSQLGELHDRRIEASKQGKTFSERYDFEVGGDYAGVPTLKNLVNPDLKLCNECGAPIHDNIVIPIRDEDGRPWFQGVTRCECLTEVLTPNFERRDDATEYLLRKLGKGEDTIVSFRKRRAATRAARALKKELAVA